MLLQISGNFENLILILPSLASVLHINPTGFSTNKLRMCHRVLTTYNVTANRIVRRQAVVLPPATVLEYIVSEELILTLRKQRVRIDHPLSSIKRSPSEGPGFAVAIEDGSM